MLGRWLYRYANASQRLLMPKAYGNRAALTPAIHAQYLAPFRDPEARERVLYALARSLKLSAAFFDDLYAKRQGLATVPTHVVWGMKDGTLPPSILDGWRVALPHAVVHPFEESGHWPHEEEPERFTALVRSILTM
jgi:haloalkane dehalogenase